MALVVVATGALAMTVALLSGSSSGNSSNPGQNRDSRAIEPVAPIDPDDAEAEDAKDGDPLGNADDPFHPASGATPAQGDHSSHLRWASTHFESIFRYRRKTADGIHGELYAHSNHQVTVSTRSKSACRSSHPQAPGRAPLIIDGVEVSHQTTNKRYGVAVCGRMMQGRT